MIENNLLQLSDRAASQPTPHWPTWQGRFRCGEQDTTPVYGWRRSGLTTAVNLYVSRDELELCVFHFAPIREYSLSLSTDVGLLGFVGIGLRLGSCSDQLQVPARNPSY